MIIFIIDYAEWGGYDVNKGYIFFRLHRFGVVAESVITITVDFVQFAESRCTHLRVPNCFQAVVHDV